jgi:uncharacterized protein (AIM24 family)
MSEHAYVCRYCRLSSDGDGPACPNCGAAVDVGELRDDEGWVEQPPIRDMARIQIGQSQCQITGNYVPVAEMNLAAGDQVYFSHHVLLWADPATDLAVRPMDKTWDRRRAGLPLVMMQATGPGRIAFSENDPGELIAVPLEAGQSIDVSEDHFVVATAAVTYTWVDTITWWATGPVREREYHLPRGRYADRFTGEQRGLLILHSRGNTFIRDLADGERIYLAPGALVYKDRTVDINIHMERPASPRAHWLYIPMVRLTGPGRVAIQSQYGYEPEPIWGWSELGPNGTWRDWNPDNTMWHTGIKEREPLYP